MNRTQNFSKIPLGGDHLTVERAVSAVNAIADANHIMDVKHSLTPL